MRQINFINAMVVNEIDGIPYVLLLKDINYRWVAPNVVVEECTESESESILEGILKGMKIEQQKKLPGLEVKEEYRFYIKMSKEPVLFYFLAYAISTDTPKTNLEIDNKKYFEARWFPYRVALRMLSSPINERYPGPTQKEAFRTIHDIANALNRNLS